MDLSSGCSSQSGTFLRNTPRSPSANANSSGREAGRTPPLPVTTSTLDSPCSWHSARNRRRRKSASSCRNPCRSSFASMTILPVASARARLRSNGDRGGGSCAETGLRSSFPSEGEKERHCTAAASGSAAGRPPSFAGVGRTAILPRDFEGGRRSMDCDTRCQSASSSSER